jgi:hypothetical protein
VAHIQAILWYDEKRLYGTLGAKQSADIGYDEAARRVVSGYTSGSGGLAVRGNSGANNDDSGTVSERVPEDEEEEGKEGDLGPDSGALFSRRAPVDPVLTEARRRIGQGRVIPTARDRRQGRSIDAEQQFPNLTLGGDNAQQLDSRSTRPFNVDM